MLMNGDIGVFARVDYISVGISSDRNRPLCADCIDSVSFELVVFVFYIVISSIRHQTSKLFYRPGNIIEDDKQKICNAMITHCRTYRINNYYTDTLTLGVLFMNPNILAAYFRQSIYYKEMLEEAVNLYKKTEQANFAFNILTDNWENIKEGQKRAAEKYLESDDYAVLCMEYALVGMPFLNARLHPNERFEWIRMGIAASEKLHRFKEKGKLLGDIGFSYAQLGDIPQAIEYCQKSLVLSRREKDAQNETYMLHHLAIAHQTVGENDLALELMNESIELSRKIGDEESTANNLCGMSYLVYNLGDSRQAEKYAEEAVRVARRIGDMTTTANALNFLGNALGNLGKSFEAINAYQECIEISRTIGNKRSEGDSLGNIGIIYFDLGNYPKAIKYYEQSRSIRQEIGDRKGEGQNIANIGLAYFFLKDYEKALYYNEHSKAISLEMNNRRGFGQDLGNLGDIYTELGDLDKALELQKESLAIFRELSETRSEAITLCSLGDIYRAAKKYDTALDYYEMSRKLAVKVGDPIEEVNALWKKCLVLEAVGKMPEAILLAKTTLDICQRIQSPLTKTIEGKLLLWQNRETVSE